MSRLEVLYQWAEGVYVKAGLEKDRAALLIIIGALGTHSDNECGGILVQLGKTEDRCGETF